MQNNYTTLHKALDIERRKGICTPMAISGITETCYRVSWEDKRIGHDCNAA